LKSILQVLALIILSVSFLNANITYFKDAREISLKKDEQKKILVKYNGREKLLTLRWTLYKNGGLVLFRSYDTIVSQNILYLRHKNKSFRLKLKSSSSAAYYNVPYLLVSFKKFDEKTSKVTLELLLSDANGNIQLEYLKND